MNDPRGDRRKPSLQRPGTRGRGSAPQRTYLARATRPGAPDEPPRDRASRRQILELAIAAGLSCGLGSRNRRGARRRCATATYTGERLDDGERGGSMKFGLMFANTGPFGVPSPWLVLRGRPRRTASSRSGRWNTWSSRSATSPPIHTARAGRSPARRAFRSPISLLPLAFVAAVTKTIRLGTGILILPQRHPVYVAKEVATLDVLSKGRAILGIGSGWLAEEFEVVGVPFRERGARTDESIRALRSLGKNRRLRSRASSIDGPRWNRTRSRFRRRGCRS